MRPLFLLALAAVVVSGCKVEAPPLATPPARPVRLFDVPHHGGVQVRDYPGVVVPSEAAELAFRHGGTLIALEVKEGDLVEEGVVLAQVDPRDFKSRMENLAGTLDAARAELTALRAGARPEEIRQLTARVSAAVADLRKTENDFLRASELFEEGLVAPIELDNARRNRDLAASNLEVAEAALEAGRKGARPEDLLAAEARIKGLEAQYAEASGALDDTALRAPFHGIVARRYVVNFESVTAGQPILNLQTRGTVDILIQIPEREVAGSPRRAEDLALRTVRATLDALPGQKFDVRLKEFQSEADPATQTYQVRLTGSPPEDMKVVPGMSATVHAERPIAVEAGGIAVPVSAIMEDGLGERVAWRVDRDRMTAHRREVDVGEVRGALIEVLSGLSPGETIAATGVHFLREGMAVRAMEAAGAP